MNLTFLKTLRLIKVIYLFTFSLWQHIVAVGYFQMAGRAQIATKSSALIAMIADEVFPGGDL